MNLTFFSTGFLVLSVLSYVNGTTYEISEVTGGGAIEGIVKFRGALPKPKKILITKDHDVCGKGERVLEEVSVSKKTGGLQNVVVYIENIQKGKNWDESIKNPLLDQKDCRFFPLLMVVHKGESLTIQNSDPVFHNVHAYELTGRVRSDLFNIAQPIQGSKTLKSITPRRSNIIKVECDVHNFMEGWIFVAENPYYAFVNAEGIFRIENVPPGKYRLVAWHPILGTRVSEVSVSSGKSSKTELTFQSK